MPTCQSSGLLTWPASAYMRSDCVWLVRSLLIRFSMKAPFLTLSQLWVPLLSSLLVTVSFHVLSCSVRKQSVYVTFLDVSLFARSLPWEMITRWEQRVTESDSHKFPRPLTNVLKLRKLFTVHRITQETWGAWALGVFSHEGCMSTGCLLTCRVYKVREHRMHLTHKVHKCRVGSHIRAE